MLAVWLRVSVPVQVDALHLRLFVDRLHSHALHHTLKHQPTKRLVLETEPQVVAARVSMRGADGEAPAVEQTFSQAFASAREQIARSLLK